MAVVVAEIVVWESQMVSLLGQVLFGLFAQPANRSERQMALLSIGGLKTARKRLRSRSLRIVLEHLNWVVGHR